MGFLSAKSREHLGLNVYTQERDSGIQPTTSQQSVVEGITAWITDPAAPVFGRLVGPAGTGKSATLGFLSKLVIQNKLKGFRSDNLVLAAPTHKACREAEAKLTQLGLKRKFQTTSRLLCLQESYSPNGEQKFVQQRLPEFNQGLSLFILDECSMVGQYQIDCLKSAIHDLNEKRAVFAGDPPAKVLLVGDDRQLTPVGEKLSDLFTDEDVPEYRLTEIVRHTGPVLEQSVRTRALTARRPAYKTVGDGSEVWVTSSKDRFELAYLKALKKAHQEGDHSRVVAVASTNKRVDALCQMGRIALFGPNPEPFQIGERLLSTAAVKRFTIPGMEGMLAHSTTEIIVDDKSSARVAGSFLMDLWLAFDGKYSKDLRALRRHLLTDLPVNEKVNTEDLLKDDDGLDVPVFSCYVIDGHMPDVPGPTGEPTEIRFHSVVDDDKKRFQNFLSKFKQLIVKSTLPDEVKRAVWRRYFYPMAALDAPVQSALALTIHRSQGSTIPEVFVDFQNIDSVLRRSPRDHNRGAYTAITRAATFLGILDPTNTEELA